MQSRLGYFKRTLTIETITLTIMIQISQVIEYNFF